jgi:hypothetical protein
MRWKGYVARIGEKTNGYRVLMEKSKEKRPLGRPRLRRKNSFEMVLREIG